MNRGGQRAVAAVLRHYRTDRIGQHHFQIRLHALEETAQPGQRTGRTDTDDDGVQVVFGLRPDFRRGAAFMRQRVGRVVELVGKKRAGNVFRQPGGDVLVILDGPCRRRSG